MLSVVVPLPLPPTRGTLVTRLDPTDLRTIEVGVVGNPHVQDVLVGPDRDGVPAGAFALAGPGGSHRILVVVDDFNGDGIPDLAVHFGSSVQVRLGQSDGSFTTAFQAGRRSAATPSTLAVGDFTGDGRTDLLAVSRPADGPGDIVRLFVGNGTGTFTSDAHRPGDAAMLRETLGRASRAGDLRDAVWWGEHEPPVALEAPGSTPAPAETAAARPARAADPDNDSRALADSAPANDPGPSPPADRAADPAADPGTDPAADPGDQGATPARLDRTPDAHRTDPSPEGGNPFAQRQGDGTRPEALGDPESGARGPEADVGSPEAGVRVLGMAGPSRSATGVATPDRAVLGGVAPPGALDPTTAGRAGGDRARAEEALVAVAEPARRAVPTRAGAGNSRARLPLASDLNLARWRLAGVGQILAQAFYLGTLKVAGGNGGAGLPSLQTVEDTQMLLADLTQRLTESFTRLVQSFYLHFLGRAATAGEVSGWVGLLLGGQTEEQVLSAFLSTAAFYQRAGALGTTGTRDERFIRGLYSLLLDRAPDEAELGGWLGALSSLGRGGVASALLHSSEFRTQQVEAYFQDLLHRPATPAELVRWAGSPFDLRTIRTLLETN
jgi:hypothetical protein